MYILIKTRQSEVFILPQCFLVNFQYGGDHNMWRNVRIFSPEDIAVMREYETITVKYNGKACRLYLLYFVASKDIIL